MPPTERAVIPCRSSYNLTQPGDTYSIDDIRVPLDAGPTFRANAFGVAIEVVRHPDWPFHPADWHPDFIRWLVQNERQMTYENFASLGVE